MEIRPLGSGVPSGTTATAPAPSSEPAAHSASPSSDASAVSGAHSEPSISQVTQAVQKINASAVTQSQGIEFSIDSSSHRIVVKVVDQSNNQVIRQIPSKQALAIADSLDNSPSQGMLIQQQA